MTLFSTSTSSQKQRFSFRVCTVKDCSIFFKDEVCFIVLLQVERGVLGNIMSPSVFLGVQKFSTKRKAVPTSCLTAVNMRLGNNLFVVRLSQRFQSITNPAEPHKVSLKLLIQCPTTCSNYTHEGGFNPFPRTSSIIQRFGEIQIRTTAFSMRGEERCRR